MLTAFTFAVAMAQTPAPKGETQKLLQSYSWTIDSNGGYLGVQTSEVTKENYASFGLSEVRGVAIEKVVEGSPAQSAGLRDGDVIIRFNGEEVTSSRKLTRLVSEVAPDHKSRITVLRGGRESEVAVTIGKRPTPQLNEGGFTFKFPNDGIEPLIPDFPRLGEMPRMKITPLSPDAPRDFFFGIGGSGRRIGVTLIALTEQLAKHFNVASGVLVTEVRADSPAAKAGLKAGDIITEADGKAIKDDSDFVTAIAAKKEGYISLTVVRGGAAQTITVTPEEPKEDLRRIFNTGPVVRAVAPRQRPFPLNQLLIPGRII